MTQIIHATKTPTFTEFRVIDQYGEKSLYRMNKIDGRWSLTKTIAGENKFLASFISQKQAMQAAKFHANAKFINI